MSTTTEAIIAQIDGEIAAKLAEVAKLQAARKALKGGVTGSNGTTPDPAPKKARKSKERAPTGALEEAMQQALKAKPGMTNGEIRAALEKDGYKWSLSPLHVGKRLTGLLEGKKITAKPDGHLRRYYPVK